MNVEQLTAICREFRIDPDAGTVDFRGTNYPLTGDTTLRADLTRLVYSVVHAGVEPEDPNREVNLADISVEHSLAETISAATPHSETVEHAVIEERIGESTVIRTDQGVRIAVPSNSVVDGASGATVSLAASRPGLSPGFFLTKGSRGVARTQAMVRVYLNVAGPEHISAVWRSVLTALETSEALYHAKAVSDARSFGRRDSMVVYLGPDTAALHALAAAIEPGALNTDLSPFVYPFAPGVGVAFEPADSRPRLSGRSLGEHRSDCLAAAVTESLRNQSPLEDELHAALLAGNIDSAAVWRNRNSPPLALSVDTYMDAS
ncbi:T3SS effector HopA1 family protein [Rhodococcus qingshengii]|uniref:T3SS effector HopA1 family protein n=1 Tax=Rhodococcus qingshengii TaxID=334542 RepID=UPI00237D0814|nr:T3SS effector HopA1 family protein [Rhodococcus qingshengii]WCT06154.1 T3SS effector HopA1 family protein [Rhodococcus qingshengii]